MIGMSPSFVAEEGLRFLLRALSKSTYLKNCIKIECTYVKYTTYFKKL